MNRLIPTPSCDTLSRVKEALDPEVARRVEEWARCVTEEVCHLHGMIPEETLNQILRDVRDL
jgi:hypothetical protein